ncbi:hypothetical protein ACO2I3_19220 [Leptospira interrogans]
MSTPENNGPALIVYAVIDRGRGRKVWREIGAAFSHKDGEGFSLLLDLQAPPEAEVVLRAPKSRDAERESRTETEDEIPF